MYIVLEGGVSYFEKPRDGGALEIRGGNCGAYFRWLSSYWWPNQGAYLRVLETRVKVQITERKERSYGVLEGKSIPHHIACSKHKWKGLIQRKREGSYF